MRFFAMAAVAALGGTCLARQDLRPYLSTVAIVGAKIETSPGQVIDNGTVITRSGRIVAVGTGISVPPGADVIDGKGLFVYAGFIDGGNTKGMKVPAARPRQEDPFDPTFDFATSMSAGSDLVHPDFIASGYYDPDDGEWSQERKAGFTTALVVPTGGVFSGFASLINLSGRAVRNSCIDPFAAPTLGSSTLNGKYPGTRLGAVATARQALLDVAWTAASAKAYEKGQDARGPIDRAAIVLGGLLESHKPFLVSADASWEIESWASFANEFHFNPIYWGAKGAFRLGKDFPQAPVILSLGFGKEPTIPTKPDRAESESMRKWLEQVNNAKTLDSHGNKFAFSTNGCKDQSEFWEALRRTVKEGLPRESALAALTTNPAKILGVGSKLGTIAPGMTANLTILTIDFLDPKVKTRYLIVDGIKIDPEKQPFKFSNADQGFGGE